MSDDNKEIQELVEQNVALEREVNERMAKFLEGQKELQAKQAKIAEDWKQIEKTMIVNNVKSIKGDWGSITIVDKTTYKGDLDLVPSKFIKKALDTTKVAAAYKLVGKLPKGVEAIETQYLMRRIK